MIEAFFSSRLFWTVLLSIFITKPFKAFLQWQEGTFSWKSAVMDLGGMPSSHACMVAAVSVGVLLHEGPGTAFFVAVTMGVIFIYEAVTLRMYVENHALALNKIAGKKVHAESVGHTWPEVIVGGLIGIALALVIGVV